MSEIEPTYPPPEHLLSDLRIAIERDETGATASLDILPEMTDRFGRPRVGLLATLVDVAAGETAIREALPNWAATSDLSIQVAALPTTGPVRAAARVLRSGRQSVVLEVDLATEPGAESIGLATLGFSVLPARSEFQSGGHWAEAPAARTEFGHRDAPLAKPLLDAIGIIFDPATPGVARLTMRPYLVNSLGALQGGAGATLLEAAAERFGEAQLGSPVRVRSLEIHYLKLGRVGPIRAETREITRTSEGLLARVSLFDEGAGDAPLSVATVQIEAASS